MIKIAPECKVKLFDLVPQMVLALQVADAVFSRRDYDTIITSANDGKHSLTSLHYAGNAVDLRVIHIPGIQIRERIRDEIKEALGVDFDVILEQDPWHLHIEYQPRRPD